MPNLRGGKAYKKGKKNPATAEIERAAKFSGREDGQDYGRVTRLLGDRRVTCFCNDGIERICKIRGALCKGPKRQKIDVGDLVILSLRDCDDSNVCDILEKVSRTNWRHVRKEANIHKHLLGDGGDEEDDLFEEAGDDNTNNNNGGDSDDSLDIDNI
jgi:translation initiation factor 1A